MFDGNQPLWRRSRRCANAACIEVATTAGGLLVRDGKEPAGSWLSFSRDGWAIFVAGVRAGHFDRHA